MLIYQTDIRKWDKCNGILMCQFLVKMQSLVKKKLLTITSHKTLHDMTARWQTCWLVYQMYHGEQTRPFKPFYLLSVQVSHFHTMFLAAQLLPSGMKSNCASDFYCYSTDGDTLLEAISLLKCHFIIISNEFKCIHAR